VKGKKNNNFFLKYSVLIKNIGGAAVDDNCPIKTKVILFINFEK